MKILFAKNSFKIDDSHEERLDKFNVDSFDQKEPISTLVEYDKNADEEYILITKPGGFEGGWNSLPIEKLLNLTKLKGIVLGTTSFSWVDYEKLRDKGIDVMNTPGKSTNAVAEYNIFCMHALYRRYPLILKGQEAGLLEEVKGKVAGIVGLGDIGRRTAELYEAQGMEVIYYNRSEKDVVWEKVELDEIMKRADVVFVTIAANPELHGFIKKDNLEHLKRDSLFISITHHEVYDIDYLRNAAESELIAGLAYEDNDADISDFKGNIFITPEIAYYTKQTLRNEADIAINTAIEYISGNNINVFN